MLQELDLGFSSLEGTNQNSSAPPVLMYETPSASPRNFPHLAVDQQGTLQPASRDRNGLEQLLARQVAQDEAIEKI